MREVIQDQAFEVCACGNSTHCVRCRLNRNTAEAVAKLNRTFESGATRDSETNKIDPEAYFSPQVIRAYSEYMRSHQVQSDGEVRSGDNWQRGIPRDAYMKSMWRHFLDVWTTHRTWETHEQDMIKEEQVEQLCALLFNVQGMLHEVLLGRSSQ